MASRQIVVLFLIILNTSFNLNAQLIFLQKTIHGGSSMAGVTGMYGSGDAYFSIHLPSGSVLKKAYLIVTNAGYPINTSLILNDFNINIDQSSVVTDKFASLTTGDGFSPDSSELPEISEIHAINIENIVSSEGENYHIVLPNQFDNIAPYPLALYTHYFIWALYENETMPLTGVPTFERTQS